MADNKIKLEIITQERHVLSKKIDRISAPAVMGEVTILPKHIPLFTRLQDGIVTLFEGSNTEEFAILGGFMDVGPNNKVTVMADAAINADNINVAKAEQAITNAKKTMEQKTNEVDFKIAEASLRRSMLELKVARRQRRRQNP